MSIDWSIVGTKQKHKIIVLLCIFALSVVILLSSNLGLVAKNFYRKTQILNKYEEIAGKKQKLDLIKKTLNSLADEKINKNLPRKSGMYTELDKQRFINNIYSKMNSMDDLDAWDALRKNNKDLEYSSFSITNNQINNLYAQQIFDSYMLKYFPLEKKTKIFFDGNILKVSFYADYEYVAYKMLKMLQQIFPGYFIVKSFKIEPAKDSVKTLLYDLKFHKTSATNDVDNRLKCTMEIEWFFIKKQ